MCARVSVQVAVAGSALMVDAGANHAVYGLTAAHGLQAPWGWDPPPFYYEPPPPPGGPMGGGVLGGMPTSPPPPPPPPPNHPSGRSLAYIQGY